MSSFQAVAVSNYVSMGRCVSFVATSINCFDLLVAVSAMKRYKFNLIELRMIFSNNLNNNSRLAKTIGERDEKHSQFISPKHALKWNLVDNII